MAYLDAIALVVHVVVNVLVIINVDVKIVIGAFKFLPLFLSKSIHTSLNIQNRTICLRFYVYKLFISKTGRECDWCFYAHIFKRFLFSFISPHSFHFFLFVLFLILRLNHVAHDSGRQRKINVLMINKEKEKKRYRHVIRIDSDH